MHDPVEADLANGDVCVEGDALLQPGQPMGGLHSLARSHPLTNQKPFSQVTWYVASYCKLSSY